MSICFYPTPPERAYRLCIEEMFQVTIFQCGDAVNLWRLVEFSKFPERSIAWKEDYRVREMFGKKCLFRSAMLDSTEIIISMISG